MNEHESPVLRLKDQIAVQEPTMHGFVTRYLLDLEIIFESQWIFCRGISENSENNIILHDWYLPGQLSRHESWKLSNFDPPPASELMPTNICAEQAAQAARSSLAGYVTTAASIATSLMTYALNATIIEPDQEERPDSFRLKMIGICVLGGAATLCASAWAVFYAIKKRSRATDLATATESVSLKMLQETA